MMVFKSKQKGNTFERDLVNILNKEIKDGEFKRIPSSGAMGTALGEPLLCGDIVGKVRGIPRTFRIEAKVGYNNSTDKSVKQFTLKKEWLDKITQEANATYSIPLLMGRFSGARSGVENFVVMDIDVFEELINLLSFVSKELDSTYGGNPG